ncbi:MAG TPA: CsbD family protein [Gemmatimonadaceae bacterium]|nr:CsbD family protein [Gemmatimonadaceae bacterium]
MADDIDRDDMDRDGIENQVKGAGKEAEGKIRNSVGGLTGDTSEQIRGKAQELKGKAQRRIGEAEVDADTDL